jgi:hypothetical protein
MTEDPRNVQFYSERERDLLQTQKNKILKLIEHDCIQYSGNGIFICKPLIGYNSTTYKLEKNSWGDFECTCQAHQMKKKKGEYFFCSHIGALTESFARKKFVKRIDDDRQEE